MRLIKFRAWDTKEKKMICTGFHIIGEITAFDVIKQYALERLNDIEIMQFTGLHDKNGKEIYEGDIVRWNEWESECVSMNWYSCQDESIFGWIAENKPLDSKCEVIGNRFENPELLEDKW